MTDFFTKLNISESLPLYLAPMEDISDVSFRYLCKQYGADILITEFISADDLDKNIERSFKKFTIYDYERPIGIQIYGHRKEAMVKAAQIVAQANPDFIDINWGCPVKKIANRGAGSGMLQNPDLLLDITAAIVKAVNIPVTVKTRLGWNENSIIIQKLATQLQNTGIQALSIHGRTRQQLYTGSANWQPIAEVKRNSQIKIPIIGNGDIISPETAQKFLQISNVDALMIGRGAIGQPWIFKHIKYYLQTGKQLKAPDTEERVRLSKQHLQRSIEWKGLPRGINEMKKHYLRYFKELPDFIDYRMKLVTENKPEKIIVTLDEIEDKYRNFVYE